MRRRFAWPLSSVAVLLTFGMSASAVAQETEKADKETSKFCLGAGALGMMGGNFLTKPDETFTLPDGRVAELAGVYPGFGGVIGGGGLLLDFRYAGIIGMEVDIIRSSDKGHGDINHVTISIGQGAWHVPMLVKLSGPFPVARPFAAFGPEVVFPGSATASVDQPALLRTPIAASADPYVMLTGALGVEFRLPVPGIDLRIPFSMRGSMNPSVTNKMNDRVDVAISGTTATRVEYKSAWQYQAQLVLGVAAHFDL